MKYCIYILTAIFLFVCCNDDSSNDFSTTNPGGTGSSKPNDVINAKLFDVIDLNYPGLERAKSFYESGLYYDAAKEMLEYYRLRVNVTNPNLSLINITASEDDKLKANYAMDNSRFFVNNFYEDADAKKPYSLNNGGKINWEFKPDGASDEYQKQLHRHQWFVPQAKVYRVSNDEKYIQSWISVYKDWLENNPMPESGTNTTTWWQLQVAERLTGQTQLFEYYKNSVNFTPEWFSEFMAYFADHADFLVKYPYSGGNILISQANALAFAGVLFPEFKNASAWMTEGYQILADEVGTQFLSDGMHLELDLSYHIAAIADYYEVKKLADANSSITGSLPTNFNESLHKAAEVVMHFTYPNFFDTKLSDYCVPGFNDTRQKSWSRSVLKRNFGRYNEMFPSNQELLYMYSVGKQGKQPATTPKSFPAAGYHVLRNGWDKASTMFILSNNYAEGAIQIWSHNQPDNGTFELYHNGRNFFPDTGVYSYYTEGGANTDRKWYRQTKVHNTMTLNDGNITKALGKTLKVASDATAEVVAVENQGYTNLKHRRYVFFVDKKFFVLIDEGIGSASGSVALNYHLCEGSNSEVVIDNAANGAHTAFADGNNMIIRTFANNAISTTSFNGKVSYSPGVEAGRNSFCVNMTKEAGQTARYITVLYPAGDASSVSIDAAFKNAEYQETGVAAEVTINGKKYDVKCDL
ncbi:heparin-sulfate lyase HepC [Dysgonomonas sp. 511]|uniref:heparin-sulfate lyase HepC n=1 Tax=Dysgonomonas sp. 511 TaxID=2302930 RepID=UPI0013D4444D|nr:heparin-sulfate lyase HepC [Dysgonomonas sp. 511]NDV79514.1 heparitin sulfate lyase [Dysgonomonas sp. 511]